MFVDSVARSNVNRAIVIRIRSERFPYSRRARSSINEHPRRQRHCSTHHSNEDVSPFAFCVEASRRSAIAVASALRRKALRERYCCCVRKKRGQIRRRHRRHRSTHAAAREIRACTLATQASRRSPPRSR